MTPISRIPWLPTLVALASFLAWPHAAEAGDRQLEVILVDMTPDDIPSRKCLKEMQKVIAADYSTVTRMAESKLRKKAGKPTKGESFIDWPAKIMQGLDYDNGFDADTIILVDCRPPDKSIDVLMRPASGAVVRVQLRDVVIDKSVTSWLATSLLRRAWLGFSP